MESLDAFRQLASQLRGRATTETEHAVGADFNSRIDASLDLADHGEEVVGFENLVSNVHEFGIDITSAEARTIERLAGEWEIRDDRWSFVRDIGH